MGLSKTHLLVAAVALFSAGCVELPEGAIFACDEDSHCPAGYACRRQLCIPNGDLVGLPDAAWPPDASEPVPPDASLDSPDAEVIPPDASADGGAVDAGLDVGPLAPDAEVVGSDSGVSGEDVGSAGQDAGVGLDASAGIDVGSGADAGAPDASTSLCANGQKDGTETDLDCGGGPCPQCAVGKICSTGSDCVTGLCSATKKCVASYCEDGLLSPQIGETAVDCGGPRCAKCGLALRCSKSSDCLSNYCQSMLCVPANCSAPVVNGTQTDLGCGGAACPACADGKKCLVASDCASGHCDLGLCRPAGCHDGQRNGTETASDCGGACAPCPAGQACALPRDCASGICTNLVCAAGSCSDGVKNGDEADVDCGGTCPTKCISGKSCRVGADCIFGHCSVLTGLCVSSPCINGLKDLTESDVDCGGNCGPSCQLGTTCTVSSDCVDRYCNAAGICSMSACNDGIKNGTETDVDCAGACTTKCANGQQCGGHIHCQSFFCMGGICKEPTCTDLFQNAEETDVDCGGKACPPCGNGKRCIGNGDCFSGICQFSLCRPATCSNGMKDGSETGTDCGGICLPCGDLQGCAGPADCQSQICSGNVCQVPTCTDSVQNGSETSIDCGPGCPVPCPMPSCPLVFSWTGISYEYESDLQGSAMNAGSVPATAVVHFRPMFLPLQSLSPDSTGLLRVKLRESLPETTYLDEIQLLVVDHPEGTEVYSSTGESTASFGYSNPFTLHPFERALSPVAAVSSDGVDILARVTSLDNSAAPTRRDANLYWEFDFGALAHSGSARLLIDGWSIYNQPDIGFSRTQPRLQIEGPSGWVDATRFGFPAGDLKGFVVPVHGLGQSHRVRIYPGGARGASWTIDRIRLDVPSREIPIQSWLVPALSADLHHRGGVGYAPVTVDSRMLAADDVIPDDPQQYSFGAFTRYGDVTELIGLTDDVFAIMRHGDEVTVEFVEPLPPEPGMRRSYFLKADYYYKGFLADRRVEPLPFHGMSAYPPPAGQVFPADPVHDAWLRDYQTRILEGP